jgi:hypothetical protein
MKNKTRAILAATVATVAIGAGYAATSTADASTSPAGTAGAAQRAKPVQVEVFAPERGDNAVSEASAGSSTWNSRSTARTFISRASPGCS